MDESYLLLEWDKVQNQFYFYFTFYLKVCAEKIYWHKLKKLGRKKFYKSNVTQLLD